MPDNYDVYQGVPAEDLESGDLVMCEAGDVIPGDGEVIEGIASVNEAAITGESAPVIRESGGDRSAVTGGTTVISDRIVIRITFALFFFSQGDGFTPMGVYDGLSGLLLLITYLPALRTARPEPVTT